MNPDQALDREDRSSDVSCAGDTRQSFSGQDDEILHTHHLCRIMTHRKITFQQIHTGKNWRVFCFQCGNADQTRGSQQPDS